jgi:hypothetical protein
VRPRRTGSRGRSAIRERPDREPPRSPERSRHLPSPYAGDASGAPVEPIPRSSLGCGGHTSPRCARTGRRGPARRGDRRGEHRLPGRPAAFRARQRQSLQGGLIQQPVRSGRRHTHWVFSRERGGSPGPRVGGLRC